MLGLQKSVFVLLVVAIGFDQGRALFGHSNERAFVKINKMLVDKVSSDNVEDNMAQAEALLRKEEARKIQREGIIFGLEKLLSLKRLEDPTHQCNMLSYYILKVNDDLSDGAAHKAIPLRRIDKLVRHYAKKHADECAGSYLPKFNEKYARLDAGIMSQLDLNVGATVKRLSDNFVYLVFGSVYEREKKNARSPKEITESLFSGESYPINFEVTYKAFKELAKDDPRFDNLRVVDEKKGGYAVDTNALKEMVNKHLLAPCSYYMTELNEVFMPYLIDETIKNENPEGRDEFYDGLSKFWICKKMTTDNYLDLISGLVWFIENNAT